MRLRYGRYSLHKGVQKIKTKTALVLSTLVLAVGGTGGMAIATFGTAHASPTPQVVYDALPGVSPATSYTSQPFQAQQVSEFGDLVHLGGTSRVLNNVTVSMSDYAPFADYSSNTRYSSNPVNWTHPITLNVYNVVSGTPNAVGSLIGTVTQTIAIPWRPAGDTTCPLAYGTDYQWKDGSGVCRYGYAFNATFDLSGLNATLPSAVIVTVAFNTQSYGSDPIGTDGPYNSLNVAVPENQTVSVGSDDANSVFLSSTWPGAFVNGSLAGLGLKEDTGWAPYGTVAMQITATAAKDQCKDNGWKNFNNPTFKNQGDCVSFVVSNGKSVHQID